MTAPEEGDEERGRERRRLDRDPHQAEVVHERHREHRRDRQLDPDVEPTDLGRRDLRRTNGIANVGDRIKGGDRRHNGDDEDDESRERVDVHEPIERVLGRTGEGRERDDRTRNEGE